MVISVKQEILGANIIYKYRAIFEHRISCTAVLLHNLGHGGTARKDKQEKQRPTYAAHIIQTGDTRYKLTRFHTIYNIVLKCNVFHYNKMHYNSVNLFQFLRKIISKSLFI